MRHQRRGRWTETHRVLVSLRHIHRQAVNFGDRERNNIHGKVQLTSESYPQGIYKTNFSYKWVGVALVLTPT